MNDEDIQYLNLLSTFHYIVAGIMALVSCMYMIGGYAMVSGRFFPGPNGAAPPPFVAWIFGVTTAVATVAGWTLAVCVVIAARKLRSRRNRIFCMVVAAIECTFTPFGTVLGVFTIIVLNKNSVKQVFAQQAAML